MSPVMAPLIIDKEKVASLRFPASEVLPDQDLIRQRNLDVSRAVFLGNVEKVKIKIIFEDQDGLKMTETTLWGATDKGIILKQGMVIPIHRIHELKF